MSWIEATFQRLDSSSYQITSQPAEYNCIAWAAGDDTRWWSHLEGYYWPVSRSANITSLVEVFNSLGYEVCEKDVDEEGYEKVALYAAHGQWRHAARQLPNGHWTSKLGDFEDIEHLTPDHLSGGPYGDVYCIMRRRGQSHG